MGFNLVFKGLIKGFVFFEGLLHIASRVDTGQGGLETVGMMFVPTVM
jgi:hypothetical protein